MPNHITNIITIGDLDKAWEVFKDIQDDKAGLGSIDFNKLIPMPESLNMTSGSIESETINLYLTAVNPEAVNINMDKLTQTQFSELCAKLNTNYKWYHSNLSKDEVDKIVNSHSQSTEYKGKPLSDVQNDMIKMGKQYISNILTYGSSTWFDWRIEHYNTKWNAYDFDNYDGGNSICFHTAWSAPTPVIQKLSEQYPDVFIQHQWADEDLGFNVGETEYLGGEITSNYIPTGGSKEAYEMAANIHGLDLEEEGYRFNETENTYIYDEELLIEKTGGMKFE